MAARTKVEPETKKDGYVDLYLPRGTRNEDPYLLIIINGKIWQLPKGATSHVPDFVAEEYYRSQGALNKEADLMDEKVKEYQDTWGKLGI